MAELSRHTRRAALTQMAADLLDVLVIGGGITGAGIALDAAARGYRVGLVERGDFASGTSSRSTKLVHGGIRYLPQLDVPLVREALIERGRLLRNAPHLVRPLPFVLPLYASSRRPVGLPVAPPFGFGLGAVLDLGLTVYDALAGRHNVGRHRRIGREHTLERAPFLVPDGLKTGFLYYDAQTDDTRLTLAVLRTAAAHGALLTNYCEVRGFVQKDGRVAGVTIRETLPCDGGGGATADELVIRAHHVVNATGVWAEDLERLAGEAPALRVAPSKGTHLVLAKALLDLGEYAVVLPETSDGRIIFIVPWRSRALVGTTDTAAETLDVGVATDDEIDYLLGHLNRYMRRTISRADIMATYSGYRPLLRLGSGRAPSRLSRTHAIVEGHDGLLTIAGGKLTTYRSMAQALVDRIDAREGRRAEHPTQRLPLTGATGLAEARTTLRERGATLGLEPDVLEHLARAYGAEALDVLVLVEETPVLAERLAPDLPYIAAEVVRVCRTELALTLEDVLARRTHLAIEDASRGLAAAERVAHLMAEELGWSETQRARQIAAYTDYAFAQAGPLAENVRAALAVAAR